MSAFKCPKCGKTTGGKEKFCIDCGQPLNISCPECGETWRFMFEYKFCPGCGHSMKRDDKPTKPINQSTNKPGGIK